MPNEPTILTKLREAAQTIDNDYEMLQWLEDNKEELNKIGIWVKTNE